MVERYEFVPCTFVYLRYAVREAGYVLSELPQRNVAAPLLHQRTFTLDKQVHDDFFDRTGEELESRELKFLADEGLDLLAGYARITDGGVRRALTGLVAALADAEEQSSPERPASFMSVTDSPAA